MCKQFIDTYGDAIIALLIQDADPKTICPEFKLCPKTTSNDFELIDTIVREALNPPSNMDVSISTRNSGGEKCPMCLMAVQAAKDKIKSDKSVVSD